MTSNPKPALATEPRKEPDHETDCALTETVQPKLWREKHDVCCACEEGCDCSSASNDGPNCIQDAMDLQDRLIIEAKTEVDSATNTRKALEDLLTAANTAAKKYTISKHEDFVRRWNEQDAAIKTLLEKLVCSVPNWKCVIECYVCPILNELYLAEQDLNGDPVDYCNGLVKCDSDDSTTEQEWSDKIHGYKPQDSWSPKTWCGWYKWFRSSVWYKAAESIAINHYSLRHWLENDFKQKEKTFDLVDRVVTVWKKPVEILEEALKKNLDLIEESGKGLSDRGTHVVYDVFMRLLPLHLAIGPRQAESKNEEPKSRIPKEFRDYLKSVCPCDTGKSECCCFTNVGEMSFRERLIGPQPYIVPPDRYFDIVCCLATHRYLPAQEAKAEAKAALDAKDQEIERIKNNLKTGFDEFEANAKAAIPSRVEPCEKKNGKPTTPSSEKTAATPAQGGSQEGEAPSDSSEAMESFLASAYSTSTAAMSDSGEPLHESLSDEQAEHPDIADIFGPVSDDETTE